MGYRESIIKAVDMISAELPEKVSEEKKRAVAI